MPRMEDLMKWVDEYLETKIPEVSKSTRVEITACIIHRFGIHELETINEVNREWKEAMKRVKI